MYIMGISCFYHDSSACIIKDGQIIAAVEQERFSRKKHDNTFPYEAVQYCLKEAGITINEVDQIAFYEKPLLKFERVLFQHFESFPKSYFTFIQALPSWINEKTRIPRLVRKKLKYKGDIAFIQHHMAHAGSCFLISPYDKAAVLTIDGVGEWTTTSYGYAEGNEITLYKHIEFPHSIGLLYSTITAYLGFSVNNSEYKVMGLSAFGNMDRKTNQYYHKLLKTIEIKDDGSFFMDMSYFVYHYKGRMPSKKLCDLLGGPVLKRNSEMKERHKDIAAAVQLVTEDILTKILNFLYKETKCENVVIAGGVALNSVYNGKILRNSPFKRVWIQPNASDGGTSLGAVYYLYNTVFKNKRNFVFDSAYLGPQYSDEEIKKMLDDKKIKYTYIKEDKEFIKTIAKLIYDNNIVGWFYGRMEWGPRALGARSILSNACNRDMQAILNLKVKHREKFRPFAPVVCDDDASTYFECDEPIPEATEYMLMVYPIRKKYHEVIPAVTHVDGSGRLQVIKREKNPRYYDLIKEFGRLSKVPILINTSFNIRGEPIVCTPYEAYRCMMGTGIDYLTLNNFIIKRDDNPQDMWDSESLADD
ncbi:MAG: carbamoyltransferase [Spirochaetes bacterium]|nr:carbamoyltransferase [Spirochaetota bacterium]